MKKQNMKKKNSHLTGVGYEQELGDGGGGEEGGEAGQRYPRGGQQSRLATLCYRRLQNHNFM